MLQILKILKIILIVVILLLTIFSSLSISYTTNLYDRKHCENDNKEYYCRSEQPKYIYYSYISSIMLICIAICGLLFGLYLLFTNKDDKKTDSSEVAIILLIAIVILIYLLKYFYISIDNKNIYCNDKIYSCTSIDNQFVTYRINSINSWSTTIIGIISIIVVLFTIID